jgi:anaerobic selenocysteine-containing dehydrogenase
MEDTRTVNTFCGVCEHSCGMQVKAQGNDIVEIRGLKEHPSSKGVLCPKGLAAKDIFYANDRLKHPLKKNGNGWQEISWDEALTLCAQGLQDIKDRYGPEGLFIYHGQTYVKNRLAFFMMKRFFNLYGAMNVSSAGSECFISMMLAHFATFGSIPLPDYENSNCIVVWGSNPLTSGGVGKSYPLMTKILKDKKEQGTKLIVVDPRKTETAELADIVIQPRPGTDGALALGFIRAILDEGLEDKTYIQNHTSGFDQLKELIKGYPLDRVEKTTGISQKSIKEAARLFATTKPACIKVGCGVEHHTNGVQSIRAINILLSITGNIDVKGGNTFVQQTPLSHPDVNSVSMDKALGAEEHPMFVGMIQQAQAVAAIDKIVSDTPYPVRGMVVVGGSPLRVLANSGKVEKLMNKMEFTVVIDQFMTDTAKKADLVLPAAMFLERDEVTTNPLNLQNKVFEPQGPLPDSIIWMELARAMGYGEHFPWKNSLEAIEHLIEPSGIPLKTLQETPEGILEPCELGKSLRDGFYTYSSKIELHSKSMESNGYDPLPAYSEPTEGPVSDQTTAKEYPLILITGGRYPSFVHSQHRNIPSLKKLFPEPFMEINPKTAKSFGIEEGTETIVETKRGAVTIKATCKEGILPNIVHLPHGWNEANCNLLTDDESRDPVSGFPPLKSSLCRVRKA